MLRSFSNILNKQNKSLNKYLSPRYNFARKNMKDIQVPESAPGPEIYEQDGKKFDYIKVYQGIYPYLPLDDHPLIPGYARMIAVTRELTDKLKELNVEKSKMVISVLKNPDKMEALQTSMYIFY